MTGNRIMAFKVNPVMYLNKFFNPNTNKPIFLDAEISNFDNDNHISDRKYYTFSKSYPRVETVVVTKLW